MAAAIDDAVRELYALSPDDFLARRGDLVKQARAGGDAALAAEIQKLRKPTVAAWIVNAHVLANPSVAGELTDLGDRLRDAQDALDADRLRNLSAERRKLVATICEAALRAAGRHQPPAGLRDEVTGTFDAAIADPDVAERLGRLVRAEQWSGFGFGTGPALTVVPGGREDGPKKAARKKPAGKAPAQKAAADKEPAEKQPTAAERRRRSRGVAKARDALDQAETGLDEATKAERDLSARVRKLSGKLSELQAQLDGARDELEAARKDLSAAKTARRAARVALDRAERG